MTRRGSRARGCLREEVPTSRENEMRRLGVVSCEADGGVTGERLTTRLGIATRRVSRSRFVRELGSRALVSLLSPAG